MTNLTNRQANLLASFAEANPEKETFAREEMFNYAAELGLTDTTAYTLMKALPRAGRAVYSMIGARVSYASDIARAARVVKTAAVSAPVASAPVGRQKSAGGAELSCAFTIPENSKIALVKRSFPIHFDDLTVLVFMFPPR